MYAPSFLGTGNIDTQPAHASIVAQGFNNPADEALFISTQQRKKKRFKEAKWFVCVLRPQYGGRGHQVGDV